MQQDYLARVLGARWVKPHDLLTVNDGKLCLVLCGEEVPTQDLEKSEIDGVAPVIGFVRVLVEFAISSADAGGSFCHFVVRLFGLQGCALATSSNLGF